MSSSPRTAGSPRRCCRPRDRGPLRPPTSPATCARCSPLCREKNNHELYRRIACRCTCSGSAAGARLQVEVCLAPACTGSGPPTSRRANLGEPSASSRSRSSDRLATGPSGDRGCSTRPASNGSAPSRTITHPHPRDRCSAAIPTVRPSTRNMSCEWGNSMIVFIASRQPNLPPSGMGFALFYLRGVAPKEVKTFDIYWERCPGWGCS